MRIRTIPMLAAASVFALVPLGIAQQSQYQPEMQSALQHLREAEQDLQKGSTDKGGHRVQAIQLTKQAEQQVQAGIQYDDQHATPGEPGYRGGAPGQPGGAARITGGPTVENVTDHSAVVTWTTNVQGSSRVEYGTSEGNLTELAESPWGQGGLTHRVQLKNLRPNTTYYCQVETGEAARTGGEVEGRRVLSFRTK